MGTSGSRTNPRRWWLGRWGGLWWRWYVDVNERLPITVKALSTAALFGVGDVLCQLLERRLDARGRRPVADADPARTLRMAATGLIWTGPVLHYYYRVVARLGWPPVPTTVLDQTAGAGVLTATFFLVIGTIDAAAAAYRPAADTGDVLRLGVEGGVQKVRDQLWPTLVANWAVWPFLSYINFRWVPLHLRVLWDAVWGVPWNAFLSYRAHTAEPNTLLPSAAGG